MNNFHKYIPKRLVHGQQINQDTIPSEAVKLYWRKSVYLLFLDVAFANVKHRFGQEMRSHYEEGIH